MNLSDFAANIDFLFYKPHHSTRLFRLISQLLSPTGISLEVLNTKLPKNKNDNNVLLKEILTVPRMSTYALAAIINKAVSRIQEGSCFVNVGVWHGFTYLAGIIGNRGKICHGVDNFSQFGGPQTEFMSRYEKYRGPNHYFHNIDYYEYFSKFHKDPIGFYIYDGEHSYSNQLKGLEVAEKYFDDKCIILVDDTNWEEPRQATLDFMSRSDNEYKILFDVTTARKSHPTFWNGVMILRKQS